VVARQGCQGPQGDGDLKQSDRIRKAMVLVEEMISFTRPRVTLAL